MHVSSAFQVGLYSVHDGHLIRAAANLWERFLLNDSLVMNEVSMVMPWKREHLNVKEDPKPEDVFRRIMRNYK